MSDPKEPQRDEKYFADIDPENRVFMRKLHSAAQNDNIEIDYRIHPFPKIRARAPESLQEPRYDADYALCMYPNIEYVGPELAHMMYERRKSFRHIFLVTRGYVWDEDELRKGINAVPAMTIEMGSGLYQPYPMNEEDGTESYDPEKMNLLSYWHVHSIRDQYARQKLLSILSTT
jgi:hypothetical protein